MCGNWTPEGSSSLLNTMGIFVFCSTECDLPLSSLWATVVGVGNIGRMELLDGIGCGTGEIIGTLSGVKYGTVSFCIEIFFAGRFRFVYSFSRGCILG